MQINSKLEVFKNLQELSLKFVIVAPLAIINALKSAELKVHQERSNLLTNEARLVRVFNKEESAQCQYGFRLMSKYSNGSAQTSFSFLQTWPVLNSDLRSRKLRMVKSISY